MAVGAHLGIDIAEYDRRIRTFIPDYEEMLSVAASCIPLEASAIVDLGVGTGALAAACSRVARSARVMGIDADEGMLQMARQRLGPVATFIVGDFESVTIPACDAVVSSLALHHVRTEDAKIRVYGRLHAALSKCGKLMVVDCQPALDRGIRDRQFATWREHLMKSYTAEEADGFLATWAKEDHYVPLEQELALMRGAGFAVEVVWRKGAFAVICGNQ